MNYKQTDGQLDDQITRCPWCPFQAGGIKITHLVTFILAKIPDVWKYLNTQGTIGPNSL